MVFEYPRRRHASCAGCLGEALTVLALPMS